MPIQAQQVPANELRLPPFAPTHMTHKPEHQPPPPQLPIKRSNLLPPVRVSNPAGVLYVGRHCTPRDKRLRSCQATAPTRLPCAAFCSKFGI